MNSTWHKTHRISKNPTFEDRVKWHQEHARVCGCRKMPENIKKAIESEKKPV